jgi:hypothetical protein
MIVSSLSSQQLSTTTDSTAVVPIKALRKALLVKAERDNLKNELGVARDSIQIQDSIIVKQDEAIFNLVSQVDIFRANERNYEEIITNKDNIIVEKEKKVEQYKKKTTVAHIITVLNAVVFLLVMI